MAQTQQPHSLAQIKIALDQTGMLIVEFGYVATPEDADAGRMQFLELAMTATQARAVANDLRAAAAQSRQSDEPGHV